jgi:hypothetical protein
VQRLARRGHCVRRHARVKTRASRSAASSVKRGRTRGLSADVPTRSRARAPVSRAWITGTNPFGEIDSVRTPAHELEKMPKVRCAAVRMPRGPRRANERRPRRPRVLVRRSTRSSASNRARPGRFRACAAAPSGPLFRERREKTATLAGNGFRRFGDRAPRRARRPPRRATRPLSGAGTDTTRPRPRRNAAEANPRASPSRCSAPTSTCPSTTSRGRYGRDAPRALDRRAAAIGGSPRGFNRRNSRSTVDSCPQSISFAGFSPALVFLAFFRLSRPNDDTDRTSPNLEPRAPNTRMTNENE